MGLGKKVGKNLLLLCRDAEVLSLFAAIINKLQSKMASEVLRVFEAVFECTLQMITKNFEVRNVHFPGKDLWSWALSR